MSAFVTTIDGFGNHCSTDDIVCDVQTHDDKWDEEWMAYDEDITEDIEQLLIFNPNKCSANGVVTDISGDNQITINNDKTIKYDVSIQYFLLIISFLPKNCNIVDLTVGDVVCIESDSDGKICVKPHRFMIRTGRVTEYDREWNRYNFCRNVTDISYQSILLHLILRHL
jgi:hypothetical protein